MKKIFRMALVCALAGATLLYTGCTKDYSEDINTLDKRLSSLEDQHIKDIQDQATALKNAKEALEAADREATRLIGDLRNDLTTLQGTVGDLAKRVGKNEGDIATIKNEIITLNGAITTINGNITKLQGDVADINKAIGVINGQIADLQANKADKTWVEQTFATKAALQETNNTIAGVRSDLTIAQNDIKDLRTDLGIVQSDLSTLTGRVDGIDEDINKVGGIKDRLAAAENDIVKLKADVITAQNTANKALDETGKIWEALKNYATITYVQELVGDLEEKHDNDIAYIEKQIDTLKSIDADLQNQINNLKDQHDQDVEDLESADRLLQKQITANAKAIDTLKKTKVDLAVYEKEVEDIWKKFDDVDKAIDKVIEDYQAADEVLQGEIDDLAGRLDILEPKVKTLEDKVEILEGKVQKLEGDVAMLIARIQSVVYVPEYTDHCITVNAATIAQPTAVAPAPGIEVELDTKVLDPLEAKYFIPTPSHVKYRVYGENSKELRDAIVALFEAGNNVLSFDVVRVKTRVNLNGAELEILNVEKDDLMEDVLDITIRPKGFGDLFFYKPFFDVNHGQFGPEISFNVPTVGEMPEVPAFSTSLVITDEDASNLLTSCYNNVVAGPATIITPSVKRPGDKAPVDITGICDEEIKIPYNDQEKRVVLEDAYVSFNWEGQDYTEAELVEAGVAMPATTVKVTDNVDLSNAVATKRGETIKNPFSFVPADLKTVDELAELPVQIYLNSVQAGAVRGKDVVTYTYTVGGYVDIFTQSETEITAVQASVKTEIFETNTDFQKVITWAYATDAQTDADIFNGKEAPYTRATTDVKLDAEDMAALKELGFALADFDHQTGRDYKIWFAGDETKADAGVAMAGTIEYNADGTAKMLHAALEGFVWDTTYNYSVVYDLPSEEYPSVTVTVTGTFSTVDRDRTPITIDIPAYVTPYEPNINKHFNTSDAVEGLNAAGFTSEATVCNDDDPVFAAHHLTFDDFRDAFVSYKGLGTFAEVTATPRPYETVQAPTTTQKSTDPAGTVDITGATNTMVILSGVSAGNGWMQFSLKYNANDSKLDGMTLEPKVSYENEVTLWYGQKVIIKKNLEFIVDGLYDFEHIGEYVVYNPNVACYTTVQPLWTPKEVTTDITVPLEAYDVNEVKLDQHYRVVKGFGGNAPQADYVTDNDGNFLPAYDFIGREFWLEKDGKDVKSGLIEDPRPEAGNPNSWRPAGATGITLNQESIDDILHYYSKQDEVDVIGRLYIVNNNDSRVEITTSFNREPVKNVDYSAYVVKKYDPIRENFVVVPGNTELKGDGTLAAPFEIAVNNSVKTETSIYNFLSLKDVRGFELIDNVKGCWLEGDNTNGFATGKTTDAIYGLEFGYAMQYVTEGISPETQSRIKFDKESGVLTYNNVLQTQLAKDIVMKLNVDVEYPWGTRNAEVYVMFTNAPLPTVD